MIKGRELNSKYNHPPYVSESGIFIPQINYLIIFLKISRKLYPVAVVDVEECVPDLSREANMAEEKGFASSFTSPNTTCLRNLLPPLYLNNQNKHEVYHLIFN